MLMSVFLSAIATKTAKGYNYLANGKIKSEEIWLKIIFLAGMLIGAIGVIINLAKINKIERDIDANS